MDFAAFPHHRLFGNLCLLICNAKFSAHMTDHLIELFAGHLVLCPEYIPVHPGEEDMWKTVYKKITLRQKIHRLFSHDKKRRPKYLCIACFHITNNFALNDRCTCYFSCST